MGKEQPYCPGQMDGLPVIGRKIDFDMIARQSR
jgi:hypothetical protein